MTAVRSFLQSRFYEAEDAALIVGMDNTPETYRLTDPEELTDVYNFKSSSLHLPGSGILTKSSVLLIEEVHRRKYSDDETAMIVAFAAFRRLHQRDRIIVDRFCVRRTYQRKGIGTSLFRALEREAFDVPNAYHAPCFIALYVPIIDAMIPFMHFLKAIGCGSESPLRHNFYENHDALCFFSKPCEGK